MFYTNFEKNFSYVNGQTAAKENWWIPLTAVSLYLSYCYFGKKYMATRSAFDLKMPLAYWNLFLSTFSFMGMVRTVPHLLHNLTTMTLEENLCTPAATQFGDGAVGLWIQLFVASKVPEFIDTVFIVLRKKNLIFLHWYHHISVLTFCWHCLATESSTGLIFTAMNFSVHVIMYGYYFLMAVNMKPKWLAPGFITIAQISQMFVGTTVCVLSGIQLWKGNESCAITKENVAAGGLMYGSYLYLFCEFAVKRFIIAPRKRAAKKLAEKNSKAL
ncbi:hypothetical protein ScalyP_jg11617 [Parmales sp. scaly parma]|nr:hypothetical protein ScalyP_jg11617 [Parmales sp. scaly parma]